MCADRMEPRRLLSELLGTMLLVAAVVGSGVMAEKLAGGNVAIALLANTIATAAALLALITTLGPVSGAHFNPIVSGLALARGEASASEAALRVVAQVAGACGGVVLAHAMFDHALVAISTHERSGLGQGIGEAVATFGLVGVVTVLPRRRPEATALGVGAYIASAYWFTSSTSFANPAVTLARTLTDTFTGIRPADVGTFVVAQLAGAALGALVFGWLVPKSDAAAREAS